jgi:hypothetical protein
MTQKMSQGTGAVARAAVSILVTISPLFSWEDPPKGQKTETSAKLLLQAGKMEILT